MINTRKILIGFLYVVPAILLIVVVSFSTLWLLGKFAGPSPLEPGEFPASPISANFPPPPNFIKILGAYFDGPHLLEENNNIDNAAIFLILCQKDKNYDIIYIGETGGAIELSGDTCWSDSCETSLYVARFWMPIERYKTKDRESLRDFLETENKPSCLLEKL